MKGKYCIITGANTGIGKETALALVKKEAYVILACRNLEKGQAALEEIKQKSGKENLELMKLDLSSQISIRKFAYDYSQKFSNLHVLINNAGIWTTTRSETKEGIEEMLAVNHLGSFLLTNLLLDMLKKSTPARIVNISSTAHRMVKKIDLEDLEFAKRKFSSAQAYGQSKLLNLYFTYELAERLKNANITVNALHPGVVKTELGRHMKGLFGVLFFLISPFLISPAKGAETSIYLASSPDVEKISGKYFDKCQIIESSNLASDLQIRKKIWEISAKMTKLDNH